MQYEELPIHEVIRKRRRWLEMTQEELGSRAGVKKQHIANVENGKASASMPVLQKILDALNLEVKPRGD